MTQQSVEVDPTLSGGWLSRVKDICRLHGEMQSIGSCSLEPAYVKECRITLPVRCLDSNVVCLATQTAREFASSSLERSDDARELVRAPISFRAKRAHFSVVLIKLMRSIVSFSRARECVEAEGDV